MRGAGVHDVAVLVKQFLKDLPEPLLALHLQEAFLKAAQLPADKKPVCQRFLKIF